MEHVIVTVPPCTRLYVMFYNVNKKISMILGDVFMKNELVLRSQIQLRLDNASASYLHSK